MTGCNNCQIQHIPVKHVVFESDIMIIGESPGRQEEIQGKPFVGDSGKLLDYAIYNLFGKERKHIAIANATMCQIPQEMKRVKSILRKLIQPCRSNLVEAINKVKPKYIITLGEVALTQVLNKQVAIGPNRGKVIDSSEFNCKILPTYHPSAILRNGGIQDSNLYWVIWKKDWELFRQIINGDLKEVNTEYLPYRGNSEFSNSKFIAVDAEWNEETYQLQVFSVSDGKTTRYILPEQLNPYIKKSLSNLFRKPLVFCNRPVDEKILSQQVLTFPKGIKIDLFNIAKLIDDNLHVSLENIGDRFVGERKLDKSDLVVYNCKDTELTAKAFKIVFKELNKDAKLMHYWKNFILPVEDMLATISGEGFKIDKTKLQINKGTVQEEITKMEIKLISQIHPKILEAHKEKGISLTRADFLIDVLYSRYGLKLKPNKTTPTGKPSLREEDIAEYSEHKWVSDYITWKKLHKLYSTFLMGLEKNMDNEGYIYPNTVLYATVTGRTACFNPNLQQIPRGLPMVEKVKELFEAPDGWLIGTRDLSQSEIRVMGWLAQEKNILSAIRNKEDIHSKTASLVLGKRIEDITKEERQLAKSINFGFLYGATAKTFQQYAKTEYGIELSLDEAEHFRNKFFETYPSIPIFHRRCIDITKKYGYIRNALGRVRRLPHIYSDDFSLVSKAERQAINFPIQSFSSELALIGMYLFWKEVKDKKSVKVLWFIHDSIFFMCREDLMDTYMALLKECLERRAVEYIKDKFKIKVGYPVESDGKVGKNWATLKEIK